MIAALSAWHEQHVPAAAALEAVEVLPAHVVIEAYSVLTRLPSGLAVAPTLAAQTLARRFSEPSLGLDRAQRNRVLRTLAGAGVFGAASYDGLVALEAKAHAHTLLTLDERAQSTYQRLGAEFTVIAA
ncbi:MAG: PIN domain-containing protein [Solirubrobacteraceae bacterium]